MTLPEAFSDPTDLDALARGLDWADGVGFFFLVIDDIRLRDQALTDVGQRLQSRRIRRLSIDVDGGGLLDQLRQLRPKPEPADVIAVTGIEKQLRDDRPVESPFIRSLNVTRDGFGKVVSGPLLFVIPKFVLRLLSEGAPDFFSTRSGVYAYEGQLAAEPISHDGHSLHGVGIDLPDLERIERIADLEELYAAYSKRRDSPASRDQYLRVALRLTDLLISRGQFARATEVAEEAYSLASEADEGALEPALQLADIALRTRNLVRARQWTEAADRIVKRIGDRETQLRMSRTLGSIASVERRFGEAAEYYRQGLEIAEELKDPHAIARFLLDLGSTEKQMGDVDSALAYLRQAHAVAEGAADARLSAGVLAEEAKALTALGRLLEAEEVLHRSIGVYESLNEVHELIDAYDLLGRLGMAQERPSDAERAFRHSRTLNNASGSIPWKELRSLTGLIQARLAQDDHLEAAKLAREALALIERIRGELPDTETLEMTLRRLLGQLETPPATR
jgi:tetratricopeptide (TPR) repeat protein